MEDRMEKMLSTKICVMCGVEIPKAGSRRLYCPKCIAVREAEQRKVAKQKQLQKKRVEKGETVHCKICGNPFPRFGRRVYCTEECYRASQRKRRETEFAENTEHYYGQKACAVCGKVFYPASGSQKYCSAECRNSITKKIKYEYDYSKRYRDKRTEKVKKNTQSLIEICRLAKEKGLSYGEYVNQYMS